MELPTEERNRAVTLAIDTAETIAIWHLPDGSIERAWETALQVANIDNSFSYRLDTGALPKGFDGRPSQESDVVWFNGLVSQDTVTSDQRDETMVTAEFVRLVVTSAANSGDTADFALTTGRTS